MIDRVKLRNQLAIEEDIRRYPYDDATGKPPRTVGRLTIGIGRNLTDKPLSDAAIDFLFNEDVTDAIADLNAHIPGWENHGEVRARVFVDLVFNLGIHGLLGFPKFLMAAETGHYVAAVAELRNSKWDQQVGRRADVLETMFETGIDAFKN